MSVAFVMSAIVMVAGAIVMLSAVRGHLFVDYGTLTVGFGLVVGGYFLPPTLLWTMGEGATEVQIVDTKPLASMANTAQTSGNMYGFIERDTLSLVTRQDDGSYVLERIPAKEVQIREDADEATARIETAACVRTSRTSVLLFGERCSTETVAVHLPAGTIARDFTIDPSNG